MKNIEIGQRFTGNHAALLNELGYLTANGAHFEQYMKSVYNLDSKTFIWMVYIDGTEHKAWRNCYHDGDDIIYEYNLDKKDDNSGLVRPYRHLFEKQRLGRGGYIFVYKGKYELQKESTNSLRILKKIKEF